MKTFTAYIEWDAETKLQIGIVPGLPGAHTQGATLDELRQNLQELLELCLEEYKGPMEDLPRFVGYSRLKLPHDSTSDCGFQNHGEGALFRLDSQRFGRSTVTYSTGTRMEGLHQFTRGRTLIARHLLRGLQVK